MLQASTLQFLRGLKKHNDKTWFDQHRPAYESARKDYASYVQSVINELGKKDNSIAGLLAKDCMFRVNRDIRFSKDKSPYKTNFGASVNRGGKKSKYAGYYLHLEPGESFCGGGIWMPMPPELARVRQEIDYCHDEFRKILNSASFRKHYEGLYTGDDISLQRVPKGYTPDNPAAGFLKLKSYFSMCPLDDATLQSKDLVRNTVQKLLAVKPLIDFLNRAAEE
jgi:uncharacterized protein (TIGR02453 family)